MMNVVNPSVIDTDKYVDKINVAIRVRPLNDREKKLHKNSLIRIDTGYFHSYRTNIYLISIFEIGSFNLVSATIR